MDFELRAINEEYQEYLRDESRFTGKAESISFPKSEREILAALRYAAEHSIPVTTQGARTGLTGSGVPLGGHVLNLLHMNKVNGLGRDADGNYLVRVQPGLLLSQLRKTLAAKSFDTKDWDADSIEALREMDASAWFFSPDPTETSASLGGMVACNASGARTFRYGPVRNYVEALRVALIDGGVVELKRGQYTAKGGEFAIPALDGRIIRGKLPRYRMPPVKNASGYFAADNMDMIDLFIGSEGTLGVITEITLKLLPAPKAVWAATAFMPNEQSALKLVRAARGERVMDGLPAFAYKTAAIEYFNSASLKLLISQKRDCAAFSQIQDIRDANTSAVYVEFHGQSDGELWQVMQRFGDIIEALGGDEADTWVAKNEREMEKLLFFRHAVPESVNMRIDDKRKTDPSIKKLGTDMAVPDAYLEDVMEMYNRDIDEKGLDAVIFGHIGNNHLHVNIIARSAAEYQAGNELYAKWAAAVAAMGGTVSAEHGVGKLKARFLPVMYGEAGIREMAGLKRAFDPNWLLNPGAMLEICGEGRVR